MEIPVRLPTVTLGSRRPARKWREQTEFSGGPLTHDLLVPPGPDGRPGERLLAPSRSLYPPRVLAEGTREDFRVLLDEHASTLAAVCLRRVERTEQVEEAAWGSLRRMLDHGFDGTFEVTRDRIAGETAHRYVVVLPRSVLTEWKLAHAGWLYAVGVLHWAPSGEQDAALERALGTLRTWEWLPATPEPAKT